jgi:hypothetical protein
MKSKITLALFTVLTIYSCKNHPQEEVSASSETTLNNSESSKIKVLNFGTFHFGETSDANKTEFDEQNKALQNEVREISKMIAKFKPTIICIEDLPKNNDKLNAAYQEFLRNPDELITNRGETSMIAFDVARLCKVDKLFGIDNHMGYNYSVGDFIEQSPDLKNSIDPETYLQLTNNPFKDYPEIAEREKNYDTLSLLEKLRLINDPIMLDHSLNTNADKLLYVGIDDGFEGADNAAIFYHRNMKIYSNLNRIKMNKNDRVFILMGSAHTAMLREFMKRSPKFELVDVLEYLQ